MLGKTGRSVTPYRRPHRGLGARSFHSTPRGDRNCLMRHLGAPDELSFPVGFCGVPTKSHLCGPAPSKVSGDPSEAGVGGGSRGRAPGLPAHPILRCSACIFNIYLILFQMERKEKKGQGKVPEALKGFHCSEHLGCWLSGEVAGVLRGGHAGTLSHRRDFPSRPPPAMVCVPGRGSLQTEVSLRILGHLLRSAPIPSHPLHALLPAGGARGSQCTGVSQRWQRGAGTPCLDSPQSGRGPTVC